jgi:tetratricopeptide (TPR) repeat protein
LKLRIAANQRDVWGYRELGAVYFEQGRYSEAVTWLNMLLEKASIPPENSSKEFINYHHESLIYANKTIGACYLEVGNPKYAVPYLKRAQELKPDDPEIPALLLKAEEKK